MLDTRLARELLALLDEKLDQLGRIVAVTGTQTALIQGDDIAALMDNIESRQHLIDAIDRIDSEISQIAQKMGEPEDTPQWAEYRESLREINARIREALLQIDAQDKQNERIATEKLLGYQNDIKGMKAAAKGVTAYAAPPPSTEGVYFDKKK